ncbi:MAG: hypothetical protein H6710_09670 [Myxococcales bacterium]|nr:hypothetical protein [Myxococcales bacterium]
MRASLTSCRARGTSPPRASPRPGAGARLEPSQPRRRSRTSRSSRSRDRARRGAARWLLRELDDHLFALGLAPLRRSTSAPPSTSGSIASASSSSAATSSRRRSRAAPWPILPPSRASSTPVDVAPTATPACDRRPSSSTARRCRHRRTGTSAASATRAPARGPVARRRDLADLIERPPPPEAIVVLPALTAAAALVLHRLGVRALVSAHGGALSHAALMVRELGISALIGCPAALELVDGEAIHIDTRSGWLRRETSASPATR